MTRFVATIALALSAAAVQTAWAAPTALVLQEGASLRAAAKESAPQQA